MRRVLAGLFLAQLVGCPGVSPIPTQTVSLRLRGSPAEAYVTIDDIRVGSLEYVAARGVALPPGVHHLTVDAPGYFPLDQEIVAKLADPPAPIVLVVKLEPVPD